MKSPFLNSKMFGQFSKQKVLEVDVKNILELDLATVILLCCIPVNDCGNRFKGTIRNEK